MKALAALVLALLAAATAAAQSAPVQNRPVQSASALGAPITVRDNLFFVDCAFDGARETCALDSGDNIGATLRRLPAFAGLPQVGPGRTMGVAGVVTPTTFVRVGKVQAGEIALDGLDPVQVLERPHPYSSLGLGFFRRLQAFTLDLRGRRLLALPPPSGRRCPGEAAADTLLHVPVALSGRPIAAVWDTGASNTVADAAYVAAHPELFVFVRDLPAGADSTRTGVAARLYRIREISICGRSFHDLPVVALDMTAPKAAIPGFPDVTLGADLMLGRLWAFDLRDGSWWFE